MISSMMPLKTVIMQLMTLNKRKKRRLLPSLPSKRLLNKPLSMRKRPKPKRRER
jgi:hypothetical protein